MRSRLAASPLLFFAAGTAFAAPFQLSENYAARAELVPGVYACRNGLNMKNFTWTIEMAPDGVYAVKGYRPGSYELDTEGTITFASGPFAPDETTTMYGRLATRLSDANPTIVLGYLFASGERAFDFCARFE